MLGKLKFIISHSIGDVRFYPTYRDAKISEWKSFEELKDLQEKQLRKMVEFAFKNVPYYHDLFKRLNLTPDDLRTIEDLTKLPILNKRMIIDNWNDFKPINLNKMRYYNRTTGGSTGTPFRYRLSKYDRFLAGALLYRGWGYNGYELGDRMIFLSGTSLGLEVKSSINTKLNEMVRNIKKLSSFDMDEAGMREYIDIIFRLKPKFIRGYPSALFFLAEWAEENNIELPEIKAIFTTSECLYPYYREKISNIFNCDVYDTYGLLDGGISAYECSEHRGLHIDTERSIMEVVDENGGQLDDGEGSILATSLHNYSMPLIRYDTGDLGAIIEDNCSCGRKSKLLKGLVGRSADILITPEGKSVHGWFFLYIFMEYFKGVREYQVIQEELDRIVIKIVPDADFDISQLDKIRELISRKSSEWIIEFKLVEKIERTKAGKYRFIINKLGSKT